MSKTLEKSPAMKALSLADKNKNSNVYKNMKFLGLLSGKNVESNEGQPKESIPLTYSLKIPGANKEDNNEINENKKEITNGENQKKPARKHLKLISEMDKKKKTMIKNMKRMKMKIILLMLNPLKEGTYPLVIKKKKKIRACSNLL